MAINANLATPADLSRLRESLLQLFNEKMDNNQREVIEAVNVATTASASASSTWWKTWSDWGDGCDWHFVPPDWRFPSKMSSKALWDLWYFGHRDNGIRPYRHLKKNDINRLTAVTTKIG